jgi:hypothetical protein
MNWSLMMSEENILNDIMPRLIPIVRGDPILGLEIICGPYKGVTFSFKKFTVMKERMENGMVPTQFETMVHEGPPDFDPDAAFDSYCSEILLSWLHFISTTNFDSLLKSDTKGIH